MHKSYNVYYNLGCWFLLLIVLVFAGFYPSYLSTFAQENKKSSSKTILAIFAHPDDEGVIGSMLAKYAKSHKAYYCNCNRWQPF